LSGFKGIKRHGCAAHTAQLAIKDELKDDDISALIKKVIKEIKIISNISIYMR